LTSFSFGEREGEHQIIGFSSLIAEADVQAFDRNIDWFNKTFVADNIDSTDYEELSDMNGIGEASSGFTNTFVDDAGDVIRADALTFRRADIVTFLAALDDDNSEPAISLADLARLIDQRIMVAGNEK
jgi:hypothetical protein